MTLPINYLTITLAAFPVFVIALLLIFKWRLAEAAPLAALISAIAAVGAFKTPAMLIAVEGSKGVWNALTVTFAVWTAVVLYWILDQAAFAKENYTEDYRRADTAKLSEAEKLADRAGFRKNASMIAYGVLIAVVLVFALCPPLDKMFSFFAPGFKYPESATGYGVVNAEIEHYSPLLPVLHAGLLILTADVIGMIVLGIKGALKHGGAVRVLKKSCCMAAPEGIAITAIFVMLAVMSGTGELYALTVGSTREISVLAAAVLAVVLFPLDIRLSDKKRIAAILKEEEEARLSRAAGKKIVFHKQNFYETAEGALTIAFAVIAVAFVFLMIGLWGSDETFILEGFAVILTAMVFCPMRTFIFEKAKNF